MYNCNGHGTVSNIEVRKIYHDRSIIDDHLESSSMHHDESNQKLRLILGGYQDGDINNEYSD